MAQGGGAGGPGERRGREHDDPRHPTGRAPQNSSPKTTRTSRRSCSTRSRCPLARAARALASCGSTDRGDPPPLPRRRTGSAPRKRAERVGSSPGGAARCGCAARGRPCRPGLRNQQPAGRPPPAPDSCAVSGLSSNSHSCSAHEVDGAPSQRPARLSRISLPSSSTSAGPPLSSPVERDAGPVGHRVRELELPLRRDPLDFSVALAAPRRRSSAPRSGSGRSTSAAGRSRPSSASRRLSNRLKSPAFPSRNVLHGSNSRRPRVQHPRLVRVGEVPLRWRSLPAEAPPAARPAAARPHGSVSCRPLPGLQGLWVPRPRASLTQPARRPCPSPGSSSRPPKTRRPSRLQRRHFTSTPPATRRASRLPQPQRSSRAAVHPHAQPGAPSRRRGPAPGGARRRFTACLRRAPGFGAGPPGATRRAVADELVHVARQPEAVAGGDPRAAAPRSPRAELDDAAAAPAPQVVVVPPPQRELEPPGSPRHEHRLEDARLDQDRQAAVDGRARGRASCATPRRRRAPRA